MSLLDQILEGAAGAPDVEVEIRSNLTPPVTIRPLAPPEPGASTWSPADLLLALVKPAVTVRSSLGTYTVAPAGEPGASRVGPAVVGLLVAGVLALAGYGAYRLVRK